LKKKLQNIVIKSLKCYYLGKAYNVLFTFYPLMLYYNVRNNNVSNLHVCFDTVIITTFIYIHFTLLEDSINYKCLEYAPISGIYDYIKDVDTFLIVLILSSDFGLYWYFYRNPWVNLHG